MRISCSTNIGAALKSRQRGFLLNPYRFGTSAVPEALAIYSSLVAFWEFEENDAGTQFLDAHGSNDLTIRTGASTTASSAVTGTGKVNRGFTPNSTADRTAYIPRANTNLDLPNSDWTFGGWFRGGNVSGWAAFLMGRLGSAAGGYQAYLQIEGGTSQYYFGASTDGTALTQLNSGLSPSTTDARLIACTLDRANNLLRIRIKAPPFTDVNVTTTFAGALYTGASNANFCINDGLASDNTFFSGERHVTTGGLYDQCFYCTRALSDAEFDYLYNSGNGRSYAALQADAGF